MRFLLLSVILCLALVLTASSPMDLDFWLRNRPTQFRLSRSARTKGGEPGVKGISPPPPKLSVRKGEYICGNKVCKLMPGVIPEGCNGICQYPV
ncbi:unnamed protein product, partial [Brenthis ino]